MAKKIASYNSATGEKIWEGTCAGETQVNEAVLKAKSQFPHWSEIPLIEREVYLHSFQKALEKHKDLLSEVISQETGKPLWDAKGEVAAMIGKVPISIQAFQERSSEKVRPILENVSITRHKPHGVVAVFGPYNFPGHLPNGHIVPALLAGNTVVFKPSELTPKTAEATYRIWQESGLPEGVINILYGDADTGKLLALHPGIKGLFFTGSWKTGHWLSEQFLQQPGKILALEMGGNNPLIVDEVENYKASAYITIQSAFLSSGQRCTCARRLIVPGGEKGDRFIHELRQMMGKIRVGHYNDNPQPFMGPLIHKKAAQSLLQFQQELIEAGGQPLVEMQLLKPDTALLSPGLIDVTAIKNRADSEIFGPLLQLIRTKDFRTAIEEANNTEYGLSAGLVSDNPEKYALFQKQIRAGVVNWNTQLTGASSAAPFGGLGKSGNFRPSAYYAVDYCSFPVASLEKSKVQMAEKISPGLEL